MCQCACPSCELYYEHVNELVDVHGFELALVKADIKNSLLLLLREAARQVPLVLLDQERDALLTAAAVANGIFYLYPPGF